MYLHRQYLKNEEISFGYKIQKQSTDIFCEKNVFYFVRSCSFCQTSRTDYFFYNGLKLARTHPNCQQVSDFLECVHFF